MRARSLNFRLIAASIAAVLLAVIVFGVGARVIVSNQMHSSLDRSLRRRAIEVARLSVSAPAVLTSPGALESPLSGRQLSVEVLDRHRVIVARSLALGAKLLPRGPEVGAALRGDSGYAEAELGGEPIRIFAAPIADVGGPAAGGVALVAASTADIEDTLHQLTVLLLLCGAVAVLVGGLAAALLTRRSVRPLRELASSAAKIEQTGDASRRLAEPANPEEIGELARTLNAMLGALERAQERERRFLADASHELRTPLTSLIGNVDFLARHGAGAEVIADLQGDAD
ncbi:MAG TPA: HAMP domain-containing protein, partial [Solirubrobacterales bacterium]|nr:HAMP domain-containing protein [Solirubrobacterales bacterium]